TFGLDLNTAYAWAQIEDAQEYSKNIYQFLTPQGGAGVQPMQSDLSENPVIVGEEEEFTQ
ncbi:MAG: hypothetical protein IKR47_04245, partial [Lachnospiraceae bacterium]|nr:hypothetical protein [Lachnospiraceae bacterium]